MREVLLPALQRGAWVISDRFTDSSYAYQGAARGLDAAFIAELERRVVGIEPGLTLLLDLGVAHGRERTRGRDLLGGSSPDRIERERDEFFERVREGFLLRASQHPQRIRIIDASPVSYTHLDVYKRQVSCRSRCWERAAGRRIRR